MSALDKDPRVNKPKISREALADVARESNQKPRDDAWKLLMANRQVSVSSSRMLLLALRAMKNAGSMPKRNKPGRPPIHDDDKRREQRIFSRNEWAQVKAMAAAEGMTAAAYVRASVQRIAQGS